MMSSATLHQAIERLARMMPLLDEDRSIELRTEGAHYRLIDEGEPVPPPLMIEAGMAALLGFAAFFRPGAGCRCWRPSSGTPHRPIRAPTNG